MKLVDQLFSPLRKLFVKRKQAFDPGTPNVWSQVNHVENFGETQLMKMEDGNIVFMSVGLDTIKVFVARNLKSLSSFSEVASYAIGRSSGDRRKHGDAILQQLRDAVGLPKSIEQLRCNLTKVNPDMLKHGAIDDAEEIYEFGRKNRIKDMDKSWLRRRLTPQEETALYSRARTGIPPGPFVTHLRNFLAHRVDRDELWEFGTSDESWKILAGRAGIAIVRNGEVFDRLTTHLN